MAASEKRWFVLRDLKRRNAKVTALQELSDAGLEVFTPMKQTVFTLHGKRIRKDVPVIQDLLFAHASKEQLDPIISILPLLQYRYKRGCSVDNPMVVKDADMERFIKAVSASYNPIYYSPGELTPAMTGKKIRIVGGNLDGMEGNLLSIRGMRKRRLIVELPDFITAAVEVEPDYIEFL